MLGRKENRVEGWRVTGRDAFLGRVVREGFSGEVTLDGVCV